MKYPFIEAMVLVFPVISGLLIGYGSGVGVG